MTCREKMVQARNKRGLLQKDVAAMLKDYGFNISTSYYGMIERGERTPNIHLALAIARIIEADPFEIFFGNENNNLLGELKPTGTGGN